MYIDWDSLVMVLQGSEHTLGVTLRILLYQKRKSCAKARRGLLCRGYAIYVMR